jgi:DNA-binding CsgD family transcriptional regulator
MLWGCDSFICLRDMPDQIREQIKTIIKGLNSISADVLDGIREQNLLSAKPPHFTPREIEIIRCTAKEKTIKETAGILGIDEDTVRNYRAMLYKKCGVNNMVGLVKAGLTAGILMIHDLLILFQAKDWEE